MADNLNNLAWYSKNQKRLDQKFEK